MSHWSINENIHPITLDFQTHPEKVIAPPKPCQKNPSQDVFANLGLHLSMAQAGQLQLRQLPLKLSKLTFRFTKEVTKLPSARDLSGQQLGFWNSFGQLLLQVHVFDLNQLRLRAKVAPGDPFLKGQ